jgi:hypothetical protein
MQYTHPATRPRSQIVPGLYHYHSGDVFLPGAGNAAFEPAFQLPVIQLIGYGIYAGPAPSPIQRAPQIYVSHAATVAGLGGVIAGQFVTQPLNVPDTSNGSQ